MTPPLDPATQDGEPTYMDEDEVRAAYDDDANAEWDKLLEELKKAQ